MSVPLGSKFITTLIGVLIVLTQTPASAQNAVDLGGTDCGSLTLQQCRATQILRAQSLLQSWRVYGAQPQLSVPALSSMLATGNSAYASSPSVSRPTKHNQRRSLAATSCALRPPPARPYREQWTPWPPCRGGRCGHDPAVLLRNYAKRTAKGCHETGAVCLCKH